MIQSYLDHLDRGGVVPVIIAGHTHVDDDRLGARSPTKYIENCGTTIPTEIKRLADRLTPIPENFTCMARVKRIIGPPADGSGQLALTRA
ncbi:MAG: hypothetical protein IPN64_00115 [Propionivibrio sp.]|uniref:hypothetical protein n=1 Tax=Propionivibrio sp. TaxID=2212460 RepID=UPI0025DA2082|nr:hypothetical protein [Propionivibrio sp.]MBK8892503.1 hypothetical protein [Propionivibrio sp.]